MDSIKARWSEKEFAAKVTNTALVFGVTKAGWIGRELVNGSPPPVPA